jgi:hypothetical protein
MRQHRLPNACAFTCCVMILAGLCAAKTPDAPADTMVNGAAGTNVGSAQGALPKDICTTALVGAHTTYDVGPGKKYPEADTVPFGTLVAGDVVNIYARAAPYNTKIGLRAQGTAAAPVIINGVSDAACNKPVLDFAGAKTARGSAAVFNATPQYGESLGGLVIKRGPDDPYGAYEPRYIIVQGLRLQGAHSGASYTTLTGKSLPYGAFTACLWVQHGEDFIFRNNVITDCGLGIFMMAKDESLSEATQRVNIANNRIYGNGVVGSYSEHDLYVQAANPLVEGNFIGPNRSGSVGSSYKSRSSGEVFRHNYVICTSRCLDFVHSEEQSHGIAKQSDYGTDYVYSNTLVSDGPEAIHYGGDNMGEQNTNGITSEVFVPPLPYRKHLRFWNNSYALSTATYRTHVFALSAQETQVDAWGNTFNLSAFKGNGYVSWVLWSGTLRFGPGNVTIGAPPIPAEANGPDATATEGIYSVTTGNPIPDDPKIPQLR